MLNNSIRELLHLLTPNVCRKVLVEHCRETLLQLFVLHPAFYIVLGNVNKSSRSNCMMTTTAQPGPDVSVHMHVC